MIRAVPAEKPCRPEIGDFMCGEDYFVNPVTEEERQSQNFIPLHARSTSWDTLSLLGIDTSKFRSAVTYRCPFVAPNRYFGAVPVCLRVADVAPYRNGKLTERYWDYMFDIDWIRKFYGDDLFKLNRVSRSMMGHGYTDCTLPSDGDAEMHSYWVGLDNGDSLFCKVWVWYNK